MKFIETDGDETFVAGVDRGRRLMKCRICRHRILPSQLGVVVDGMAFHKDCFYTHMETIDAMQTTEVDNDYYTFGSQLSDNTRTPTQSQVLVATYTINMMLTIISAEHIFLHK